MTIRQEAYDLIDSLPDKSIGFVLQIIRNMSPEFFKGTLAKEYVIENTSEQKINQIAMLKDNWNDNGAKAFSKAHIDRVRNIALSIDYSPEIFPTACDTIQLEFERKNGSHLEIEIPETDVSTYYYVDAQNNEHSGNVETDADSINSIVRSFYESRLCK